MAINLPESIDSNYSSPLSRPFTESRLPIYHPSLHSWKGGWLWDTRVTVTNQPPPSHVWRELYPAPTKLFHLSLLKAFLKLPFAIRAAEDFQSHPLVGWHWSLCRAWPCQGPRWHWVFHHLQHLSVPSCDVLSPWLQELQCKLSELCPQSISQHSIAI